METEEVILAVVVADVTTNNRHYQPNHFMYVTAHSVIHGFSIESYPKPKYTSAHVEIRPEHSDLRTVWLDFHLPWFDSLFTVCRK